MTDNLCCYETTFLSTPMDLSFLQAMPSVTQFCLYETQCCLFNYFSESEIVFHIIVLFKLLFNLAMYKTRNTY